jgi:hypothetical protein
MVAAIALCAGGIALVVSALCAWLTLTQAQAAQRLAREAARLADEATRVREMTAESIGAQANALNQGSHENREALAIAERTARAAEESARAAEESARATRMLAESAQRAYIGLGSMQVVRSDVSVGSPTVVRCEIRNSGKTPAFAVSSAQWLRPLAELPAEPDYTGIDSTPKMDLAPGSVQTSDTTAVLDVPTTKSLRARELTVFLYGISRYTDIFGLARQTRWAFYWNPEKRQFTRCGHHNDMT